VTRVVRDRLAIEEGLTSVVAHQAIDDVELPEAVSDILSLSVSRVQAVVWRNRPTDTVLQLKERVRRRGRHAYRDRPALLRGRDIMDAGVRGPARLLYPVEAACGF